MSKHKYKFTNKKHSVGGVVATIMAVAAIVLIVFSIVLSFKARGEGGEIVGSLALMALAFSVFGLIIGLLSYREFDRYYTFSLIGSLINGIIIILLIMLLFVGI
ncbi:DUF6142 family protein [Eshraghiella crossota]|jgi:hypothetical protein|uniref:DUF6142 family protein n=1 Tax=Eshraghiella crossota TaxID=45851 RepID=UPI002EB358BC|nr:DUF6142 family protein [Butyrivibrio crossotus]